MEFTYKAIFFDWDGTLVEHSKLISDGHTHVRRHFGLEDYDQQAALSRGHQSTRELYPLLYGERWQEAEQLFYDFFFENHLTDVNPFMDTLALLDAIDARKVPMGVVSNKRQVFLAREIEHIKWNRYFGSIVGAGEAEKDKPSSAPLKMAATMIAKDLTNIDILYVGDTETDLKCAADMDCDCALILRGRDMTQIIDQHNPKYVFDDFSEMSKALGFSNNSNNEKKAC